jgi:hypothetical protein
MSKHSSKRKRRSTALSASLGIASLSLALAGGAAAAADEGTTSVPSTSQSHEVFLDEEEISDVSLATFYVFDKENAGPPPLAQQLRLARSGGYYRRAYGCGRGGACGGCGGCAGCGGGGGNTNGGCGGGVDNYP